MTRREILIQIKAFARVDGVYLALLWIVSFIAMLVAPQSVWCTLLAFATPFLVGARLKSFREYVLEGLISFRRAFAYSWYVFLYGSLLFAIAQFVYFRFLDNGHFVSMIYESGKVLMAAYEAQGIATDSLKAAFDTMTTISPAQYTIVFLSQNIIIGTFLSLPIALFCRRGRI